MNRDKKFQEYFIFINLGNYLCTFSSHIDKHIFTKEVCLLACLFICGLLMKSFVLIISSLNMKRKESINGIVAKRQ
jgi:hypothetical protein